ncbi:hypothetical protein QVD17_25632 [Tagetes erecta]|uniref:Avr9/Cf-9 rapidly elicited protein 146 n=1 Tax=Tagetes erecta TaxID=13708 RepID=A0AAD8KLF5_TARER|nr:hypothetical protein QVD17_25632 [Tagetes erecta]
MSKTKLSLDLNMIIKRSKIAGKALQNLMLHHHKSSATNGFNHTSKKHEKKSVVVNDGHEEIFVDVAVIKALEMLTSAAASPAVCRFGKSPMVRQLRITDSPFPLCNGEEDSYVDEAAEKFILKFYDDLRRQC